MNNPNLNDLTLALEVLTEKLDHIEQTLENLRKQVENVKTSQYYYHHHYLPAYPIQPIYPPQGPWCGTIGGGTGAGSVGVPGITYWGGTMQEAVPGASPCGKKAGF